MQTNFSYGLTTDLYQLTMAAGYFTHGCVQPASFELFVRRLPSARNYMVVAGIGEALDYIMGLRFTTENVEYLRNLPQFKHVSRDFFNYLREFRFNGDIWAMPEGSLAFGDEPILRVTAPIIEAQILETYLLAAINFQTMIASKAARIMTAARADGRPRAVIEMGTRRAHGPHAGIYAARAAYLGGCTGTSNLAAGQHWGIPVFGTAAHAWTLAFDNEVEAFEKFYQVFPESSTLLIDTYNTSKGAEHATQIGVGLKGVRIDSGDLAEASRQVRQILDSKGLQDTKIVVSGDLNEYSIYELVEQHVPIDTFGVGTELVTSRDVPALGGVYKMVERLKADGSRHYTAKFSAEKISLPGIKQVFRHQNVDGHYTGDTIGLAGETAPEGSQPVLVQMIQNGRPLAAAQVKLSESRARAAQELSRLSDKHLRITGAMPYPVKRSERLENLLEKVRKSVHS